MSDDAKFFYANAVQIAVTPYDLSMNFIRNGVGKAEVGTTAAGEIKPAVLDSLTISMSPTHAKAMLPAIYKAIVEYEKKFGKLGLPTEMQTNFDSAFGKLASGS